MGIIDDIKQMEEEGRSESEIRETLTRRGISDREIDDGMSQAMIKDAVSFKDTDSFVPDLPSRGDSELPPTPLVPEPGASLQTAGGRFNTSDSPPLTYSSEPYNEEYSEMQPSILSKEQQASQEYYQQYPTEQGGYTATGYEGYPEQQYATDVYQQYQPYQESVSSDIISEISEQVVNEKLSAMQEKLEKAIDFRTVADAQLTSLNERLKRIEKIIDRLQLSVLQKMGDYVNDIQDVKKELEETQKSFTTLRHTHKEKHVSHSHSVHGHTNKKLRKHK